ncbi:MAG: hypothetical protein ACFE8A_13380 [Candidatus Hodarchaeota archaeon]
MSLQTNEKEIMKGVKLRLTGEFEIQTIKENLITEINIEAENFEKLMHKLLDQVIIFGLKTLEHNLELFLDFEKKKKRN